MNTAHVLTPQEVGLSTLEHLNKTDRLNYWMFESILPYVKGKTLEIGSGIGNISSCFAQHHMPISLSDYNPAYCRALTEKFQGEPCVEGVYHLDLADPNFDDNYPALAGTFDTVFALNVVEHIADDGLALKNCYKLLKEDGHVIILVPAYQALYNVLDKNLEHYKRYTRSSLRQVLTKNNFDIVKTWHFNLAGIAGWWWAGRVQKKQTLPAQSLSLYNKLVLLFQMMDIATFHQVGLSVIGVGRK